MAGPTFQQTMRRLQGSKKKVQAIKEAHIQSMVTGLKYYGTTLIAEHFSTGNMFRMGWPPLSPGYEARKILTHGIKPMLVATEELKNSVVGLFNIKIDRRKNTAVVLSFDKVADHGVYVGMTRPWSQPTQEDTIRIQAKTEQDLTSRLAALGITNKK